MVNIHFFSIITRNLLTAYAIVLLIDFSLANTIIAAGGTYHTVLIHSLVFGTLIAIVTSGYEISMDYNIQKKAKQKKLRIRKLNLASQPSHYLRGIRVFVISSFLCLALIALISAFEPYPLSVYAQLSVVPAFFAMVANTPQSYVLYIDTKDQRQATINVIQNSLGDSVFEASFKDSYHLEYQHSNTLTYYYAYFFAPDRCSLDLFIYQQHVELKGSAYYLEALLDDPYITEMLASKQQQEKKGSLST